MVKTPETPTTEPADYEAKMKHCRELIADALAREEVQLLEAHDAYLKAKQSARERRQLAVADIKKAISAATKDRNKSEAKP